jgi:hypothetical protein
MRVFEQDLYVAVCVAIPGTTVRSFSKLLGKSSGYWSSITAQGLVVSNAALIHLHDSLDVKLLITDSSSPRYKYLQRVQDLVETELLERISFAKDRSTKTFSPNSFEEDYGVMPISVVVY